MKTNVTSGDQSFNGIANKFERNIYGTTKGRLRHAVLCHVLEPLLNQGKQLSIIDLGGGTGVMAEHLLRLGHQVDVVDVSDEVLALAKERLQAHNKVRFHCASLQDFIPSKKYDIVMCHAVLEWLSAPLEQLNRIVSFLKPDGMLSLSFFNQDAKLFANALYGNFEYIEKGMQVKNQVRLSPQNPLQLVAVTDKLQALGVKVSKVSGIRCFHDYLKRAIASEEDYQDLLALEKKHCQQAPFRYLGKYLHLQCHLQSSASASKAQG